MNDNKETLRRCYELFNERDIRGALGVLDRAVDWSEPQWEHAPGAGGDVHGRHQVLRQVLGRQRDSWDLYQVTPQSFFGEGDVVVVEGSLRARPRGADATFDVPFTHIWTMHDGKAVRMRALIETEKVYERWDWNKAA